MGCSSVARPAQTRGSTRFRRSQMRHLIYLGTMLALRLTFASVEIVQADRLPGSDLGGRPLPPLLSAPHEVPPAPSRSQGTAAITLHLGQRALCYLIDLATIQTVI